MEISLCIPNLMPTLAWKSVYCNSTWYGPSCHFCVLVSTILQFPQCQTCLIRLHVPLPALHISHVIATCLIVLTILTHSTSPPQVTWKLHTKFTAVPLSHSYFTCSHNLDVLMSCCTVANDRIIRKFKERTFFGICTPICRPPRHATSRDVMRNPK